MVAVDLAQFVRNASARHELVVQPRMGMSDPAEMASGLGALEQVRAPAVGTITLDSYTRVGDHHGARYALERGRPLNGYPLVNHGADTTRHVVSEVEDLRPVQIRHGSAAPNAIFRTMAEAGLTATEGGPVSYCLPYGRTPLAESIPAWAEATAGLGEDCRSQGLRAHLETFGGCLLGQLCPPSMLVAMSVLEGLFFVQQGIDSLSLSYAQQTDPVQDLEALGALRILADEMLPRHVEWHLVLYTYMGVYPQSIAGSAQLLGLSAHVAVRGGVERLIVKTSAEAWRIPTIEENIEALRHASRCARAARRESTLPWGHQVDCEEVLAEARTLVESVLCLSDDIGLALRSAFSTGLLDVPFCLHRDNHGAAQAFVDTDGRLKWASLGNLPLARVAVARGGRSIRARALMSMLRFVADRHDRTALSGRSALSH
ncbi:glutamate mutase epsilon subunit [Amycolatopsis bartoniae]|uniref:Methylaspartate mutase n=1 Tax=Amycolatopsis bartoniae TaxID=941986 RepID=A0A8H9J0G8_9PSEU|nr:methylaspartate mutase [Amycolatopsis bartoniae]MBB2940212.1 glutamate mutase epsilon subunit [Amycolatopsis bartoniae]GHF66450.1 methylaspartate mutase [Amycolatopsis bartoniae]